MTFLLSFPIYLLSECIRAHFNFGLSSPLALGIQLCPHGTSSWKQQALPPKNRERPLPPVTLNQLIKAGGGGIKVLLSSCSIIALLRDPLGHSGKGRVVFFLEKNISVVRRWSCNFFDCGNLLLLDKKSGISPASYLKKKIHCDQTFVRNFGGRHSIKKIIGHKNCEKKH